MRLIFGFVLGIQIVACASLGSGGAVQAAGSNRIALILDASGSMNASLPDGQSRFTTAKAAVGHLVSSLSPTTEIALRAYGHQSRPSARNCPDTELLVPFGPAGRQAREIVARLAEIKALGYTPLAFSLQQSADDLASEPNRQSTIILVSDGKETCKQDPCALASKLAAANASLVVHTIGFGVDAATRSQLQCVANNARGKYFDASTMSELTTSLREAAETGKRSLPTAKSSKETVMGTLVLKGKDQLEPISITNASTGDFVDAFVTDGERRLPPGIYSVHFLNGPWQGVEVKANETTTLTPGFLVNSQPANVNLEIIEAETGEAVATIHQSQPKSTLLPGRYAARFMDAFDTPVFEITPGATVTIAPAVVRLTMEANVADIYTIRRLVDDRTGLIGVASDRQNLPAGAYEIFDPSQADSRVKIVVEPGRTYEVDMKTKAVKVVR